MKKRILLCLVVVLMSCLTAAAQDAKMQPLTFWYEYTVNPGKDAPFTTDRRIAHRWFFQSSLLTFGCANRITTIAARSVQPMSKTREVRYTTALVRCGRL